MNEHISFENWEPGESAGPDDQEHLANCTECRKQKEYFDFLNFQIASIPVLEPPAFFSSRVAHLARSAAVPFTSLLERAARRLVPIFAVLMLMMGVVLYKYSQPDIPANGYGLLLIEPDSGVNVSVDDMLVALQDLNEEGNTGEKPK